MNHDDRPGRGGDETLDLGAASGASDDLPGTGTQGPQPPATEPGRPAPAATSGRSRGPRVGTIVWGFVVVALGGAVVASALGADVDMGLAAIVVLAVAGVTLVLGSVVSGARRRTHD
ncbi:hypothetical protein [Cellulosimicrobium arenosum]|uniref:Uncharacterized protein n=1 Tax=Cellulosimicrobium arenosum TaxID=2708133 RepID=A0A927G7E2_9MICO|nr:hypothetical protein [Cellulosimicrobium arenosum]MBD8078301.1 hypothetical protein [Cellulosimicrobium arenosum]